MSGVVSGVAIVLNVLFLSPGEVELAEAKYEEAKTELETAISEIQDI